MKGSGPATPELVEVPATAHPFGDRQASCAGLACDPGSSTSSSASDTSDAVFNRRLVTAVFKYTRRFAAGIG